MELSEKIARLKWREFGIPQSAWGLHIDAFAAEMADNQEKAYAEATSFLSTFRDRYVTDKRPLDEYPADRSMIGRGLLLGGPPGTGKTFLASLVAMEVTYLRLPVRFVRWAEYLDLKREQFALSRVVDSQPDAARDWIDSHDYFALVETTPLAVLDDVGKEHQGASGFSGSVLDELLRYRHSTGRPTVITSNLPMAKWSGYNASMESFLHGAFDGVTLAGKDWRRRGAR